MPKPNPLNFKCRFYKCKKWFNFDRAIKEKTEGEYIKIYCPFCDRFTEKIRHRTVGREGMNIDHNRGLQDTTWDAHKALSYLVGEFRGEKRKLPEWPDQRRLKVVSERSKQGTEGPFCGEGDLIPKLRRYAISDTGLEKIVSKFQRRVPKKRNSTKYK